MTEHAAEPRRGVRDRLADQVRHTPRWQRRLLWVALLLVAVGAAGQVAGYVGRTTGEREAAAAHNQGSLAEAPPQASRAFGPASPRVEEPAAPPAPEPAWWEKLSPATTRIGASFVVGFLIGWVFRAFLKTMILLAAVGAGALMALSYFGVLNIDFTAARETYESALHWVSDQGMRLKDVVMAHVPSSAGGGFGALVGLRRR